MEMFSSLGINRKGTNAYKLAESLFVLTFLTTWDSLCVTQGAHVPSFTANAGQSGSSAATSSGERCNGGGTYYIHEYHVHGQQEGDTDSTHTVMKPVFPKTQDTSDIEDIFNYTSYLNEKADWLTTLHGVRSQLSDERSRRLDMMAQLVSWMTNRPSGAASSARQNKHILLLRNMLMMWSEIEEWNYTAILDETMQSGPDYTVQEELSPTIPPSDFDTDHATADNTSYICGVCNDTIISELQESIAKQTSKTNKFKKDLKRLQKRNLNMFNGYKRILDATRETRRDLRSWEHRAGRLIKLYEDIFGDGTTTESLVDEVKYLRKRVWCLEQDQVDPILCPNIKVIPLTPKTPEHQASTTLRTATKRVQTEPPPEWGPTAADIAVDVTAGQETDTTEVASKPGTDIWTGNTSAIMADTMVQAGIDVSLWYLDKVRSQRPRDCSDIDFWIQRRQPVQVIYLSDRSRPVNVLCEEGWTVIMRNNPISAREPTWDTSRDRLWHDYKYGYGTFDSDIFWFGNEYLHQLTNQDDYQLRIELIQATDEQKVYAEYAFFKITKEADGFRLQIGDNQGNAGDILGVYSETPLGRLSFKTQDKHPSDLDDILDYYKEGWWYPHIDIQRDPSGKPTPCFTHLTAEFPWTCPEKGYQMMSSVVMKMRPLQDNL